MRIKVITFDLDNTLWDVERVMIQAEAHLHAWLKAEVPEVVANFSGDALRDLRTTVLEENPNLVHDLSKLRREVIYRAISHSGYGPLEAATHADAAFAEFYEARHWVVYFEGALETLATLAENYPLVALTNGNADFRKLRLDRFFSFGISAADVGVGKPAPDMFLNALDRAQALPVEAIHVGDHLIDDIQGAAEVGMYTIWVNQKDHPLNTGSINPSSTVSRVGDVPAAVAAIEQTP
ncbi:MAG: HAD family hydrolase [Gammaproteobacteria bacterium]|nr:HAD family hydrolase [Gammaproteobacteria bacterium]